MKIEDMVLQNKNKISNIDEKVNVIDEKVNVIDEKVNAIENDMSIVETNLDELVEIVEHIGEYYSETLGDNTIPNNQAKNIATLEFEDGTYIISIGLRFTANANGVRKMCISTMPDVFDEFLDSSTTVMASSNGATMVTFLTLRKFTGKQTRCINVFQNSGSNVNCSIAYSYIKIK